MASSCWQCEYFPRRATPQALCHLMPEGLMATSPSTTSTTTTTVVGPRCCRRQACMTLGAAGSKPGDESSGIGGHGEEGDEEVRDCVIVGGGIAGLAAAADLEKAGCNFVLLEAGDRLGGRIYTHKESRRDNGMRPLELGAQWLHGTVGNPLFEFCAEEGIFDSDEGRAEIAIAKESYTARGFQARRADGSLVHRREFLKFSKAWSKAVLEAETVYATSLAEDLKDPAVGIAASNGPTPRAAKTSTPTLQHEKKAANGMVDGNGHTGKIAKEGEIGAFLHRRVREILRGGMAAGEGDPEEAILGYLLRKQCAVEGCDNLDGVSYAGYDMYKELEGGDVRVPGGFSTVVDALEAKISPERMQLNSPVSMIRWLEEESSVSFEHNTRRAPAWAGSDGNAGGACTTRVHQPVHHYHADKGGTYGILDDAVTRERYPCVVEYRGSLTPLGAKGGHKGTYTKRIRCRQVLVTVGLGVLKDGSTLSFSPQLPASKLSAIRRLGFGTTDKMFVRCTRRGRSDANLARTGPDPSLHVGVMRPMADSQNGSHLTSNYNGLSNEQQQQQLQTHENPGQQPAWANDVFSFNTEGEHVCSWLTGPSARTAEAAAGNDVTKTLMSLLRTVTRNPSWQPASAQEYEAGTPHGVFQKGDADTPSLSTASSTLVRSDWHSNPLFRGSYSFVATGSSPADMEELARPLSVPCSASIAVERANGGRSGGGGGGGGVGTTVPTVEGGGEGGGRGIPSFPRVLFAGEAMHPEFFSTAHGGFETGRRAARDIVDRCCWSEDVGGGE